MLFECLCFIVEMFFIFAALEILYEWQGDMEMFQINTQLENGTLDAWIPSTQVQPLNPSKFKPQPYVFYNYWQISQSMNPKQTITAPTPTLNRLQAKPRQQNYLVFFSTRGKPSAHLLMVQIKL